MLLLLLFCLIIVALPAFVLLNLVRGRTPGALTSTAVRLPRAVVLGALVAFCAGAVLLAWLYDWGGGIESGAGWLVFAAVAVAAGLWAADLVVGVHVGRKRLGERPR